MPNFRHIPGVIPKPYCGRLPPSGPLGTAISMALTSCRIGLVDPAELDFEA